LLDPGARRDAILTRHFTWELARLLDDRFTRLARPVQQRLRSGVAALVESYLTDRIRVRLPAETAIRLAVARYGTVDDLLAVIGQDATVGTPQLIVDGAFYAAYPGFRTGLPDGCFDITDQLEEWRARRHVVAARTDLFGRTATVRVRGPWPDQPSPV